MGRLVYVHRGGRFLVTTPINGEPARGANGGTIGFAVESPKEADAWHKAGIENGGTTAEGPPGVRQSGSTRLYLAYPSRPGWQQVRGASPDNCVISIDEERGRGSARDTREAISRGRSR